MEKVHITLNVKLDLLIREKILIKNRKTVFCNNKNICCMHLLFSMFIRQLQNISFVLFLLSPLDIICFCYNYHYYYIKGNFKLSFFSYIFLNDCMVLSYISELIRERSVVDPVTCTGKGNSREGRVRENSLKY